MIQHPLALLAFMFLVIAFARALESRFQFIEKISSAVVCTLLGIALANLGVIPHDSAIHRGVYAYAVPYAIVLVIMSSRLSDLRKAGSRLIICYGLAAVGTFVGAVLASFLFNSWLGAETWKLGGTFAGAFVGGGMNFAAVGQGLEITPSLFAAAAVADNLSTVPWLLTQVGVFGLLQRFYRPGAERPGASEAAAASPQENVREKWTTSSTTIFDLAVLAACPLGALWLAQMLAPLIPGFPEVLWLTTFAILAAQLPSARKLKGAAMLSYFALHLFFIVIGASSIVSEVLKAGPGLFLYMIMILVIHGIFLYGSGWLLGMDLPSITIASQATVGGPGSALAVSMAMKWGNLATPGIIVGIFGYAIGNYIGFACAYLLRGFL